MNLVCHDILSHECAKQGILCSDLPYAQPDPNLVSQCRKVEMEITWEGHSSNMIKRDKDAQYAPPNPNFVSQCRKVEMEMRWEGHSSNMIKKDKDGEKKTPRHPSLSLFVPGSVSLSVCLSVFYRL